jgi:hypothetical protein
MTLRRAIALAALLLAMSSSQLGAQVPAAAPAPVRYANFRVSVYVTVGDVHALADRAIFDRQFARVASQVHIDKVYIEAYRDGDFATDDELERVKGYFREQAIETSGGITLAAGGRNGQFATFDYENPDDRARCARAAALAARHFDAVILDDFFFYNTKSEADIDAKGKRSWTQYRLDRMHAVARDLVIGPAKRANPNARVIIKYPNWYEHFQGTGFDLDQGPRLFDGIHTGTETRDPVITDQLLQQYESYEVIRYFDNIAPGRNGGGWVDTYDTRYVDRYAEQLWDTLFARAPEITLFNWRAVANPGPASAGDRPWAAADTSFDWDGELRHWRGADGAPAGWGRAAGYALETVDTVLGGLGHPVGVASYKPYQSSGEDFLHNYLGNIGVPIELAPTYPVGAKSILLTEAAAADPAIVDKIKASLRGGATVVVTSGLVQALAGRGFADIAEWTPTGRTVAVDRYVVGAGAGAGTLVDDGTPRAPILFPDIRFYTNDSWAVVRGIGTDKAWPVVLTNQYGAGTIVMIAIPENPSDLYRLPAPVLAQIRRFAGGALPVRLVEADSHVALFAYDNGGFVVESFRDAPVTVTVEIAAGGHLAELPSGTAMTPLEPVPGAPVLAAGTSTGTVPARTSAAASAPAAPARFSITLPAHSFRAYRIAP